MKPTDEQTRHAFTILERIAESGGLTALDRDEIRILVKAVNENQKAL